MTAEEKRSQDEDNEARAGREVTDHGDEVRGDKISTGNISGTGIAIGRGAQAQVSYGGDAGEFQKLFETIYRRIDERPPDPDVEKEEIREQVKRIEQEVTTDEDVNPGKLDRWLHTLALMAPDIFDVTVATIANPVAGFATVARKVAAKAKEQYGGQ